MKNNIMLRQGAWFSDQKLSIEFPLNWNITVFSPPDFAALEVEEIDQKILNSMDSLQIDQVAAPGKTVLIVCDDISRPTPTDLILPLLITNLENQGVTRENISILISSGTHDLMTESELYLKLGRKICEEYKVSLHQYKRGNILIGTTSRGTPVYVNKRLTTSDLVIGVGGIVPHNPAGFGGGAKLILGVCGIRTILHFHQLRKGVGTGGDIENEFRADMLEAARMAGMDFIVNCVVNKDRELIELFAGDLEFVFHEGVRMLRKQFGVLPPERANFDLVIADVYPFDASFAFTRKGWWPVMHAPSECHKLVISAMPKGVGGHMVFPIPNDLKINKFIRLYYELDAFGIRYFFEKSLASRGRKILKKLRIENYFRRKPGGSSDLKSKLPAKSPIPGYDVVFLHDAKGQAAMTLGRSPYRMFNNPGAYFEYMAELTNHKNLNVGFYQTSSLTFPDYN